MTCPQRVGEKITEGDESDSTLLLEKREMKGDLLARPSRQLYTDRLDEAGSE
jgi:hypothetical protein